MFVARILLALALLAAGSAPAQPGPADRPVVLLAGATGNNGSWILRALRNGPYAVRALSRDVAAARATLGADAAGVDWVQADATRPETLGPALAGVTYVIDAKAATGYFGDSRPEAVDYEGTRNMAAAAKAAGVRKYVLVTSALAGVEDHFLNVINRDVLVHKGRAEEALVASGVPYVIVGPSGMTDEPPGREIRLIPRSEYVPGQKITRADTATVCIAALAIADADNRAFAIVNGDGPATDTWWQAFARMPRR